MVGRHVAECIREVREDAAGNIGISPYDHEVGETLQREAVAEHLQKVCFSGLPTDDEDFCDAWEELLEVGAVAPGPFERALGRRLSDISDFRDS